MQGAVVRGQQVLLSFRYLIFIQEKDLHHRQHLHEQCDRGLLGKLSHKPSSITQAGSPPPYPHVPLGHLQKACPGSPSALRAVPQPGALAVLGRAGPSPCSLPAAAGSRQRPRSSRSPAAMAGLCWPSSAALCPATIAAPSHLHTAALLPRPDTRGQLVCLMAASSEAARNQLQTSKWL